MLIVLDSYLFFFCIFNIFSEMKCFLVKLCLPDIFGKNVISIVMGGSGVTRPRMESVKMLVKQPCYKRRVVRPCYADSIDF